MSTFFPILPLVRIFSVNSLILSILALISFKVSSSAAPPLFPPTAAAAAGAAGASATAASPVGTNFAFSASSSLSSPLREPAIALISLTKLIISSISLLADDEGFSTFSSFVFKLMYCFASGTIFWYVYAKISAILSKFVPPRKNSPKRSFFRLVVFIILRKEEV